MSVKKSSLAEGLKVAAGHIRAVETPARTAKKSPKTVLIGAHFSPEVRRALLLVQAEPENEGKKVRDLLGEAINLLCARYRKPEPYRGED
jgi:hypothetical protein